MLTAKDVKLKAKDVELKETKAELKAYEAARKEHKAQIEAAREKFSSVINAPNQEKEALKEKLKKPGADIRISVASIEERGEAALLRSSH